MTTADTTPAPENHTFEADVAKLLHLMVHSVYSDKDVFLRELISNAADACEKLRYEAISHPALLGDDPKARITLLIDADNRRLMIEDNGIGMSRDEMIEALGTIARSGTKALEERPPNAETPVILVPGEPKALVSKGDAEVPAIEGIIRDDQVYRIDWSFSNYRSVPLGQLREWLANEGYDISNRDRLRPLYGLKLQQEFGAHLLRVGPPVMPPLTYAAEGRIYTVNKGHRELIEEFTSGEVMLSHHNGATVVRMTPKLVDAMRRSAMALLDHLVESKPERPANSSKPDGDQQKIDALSRDIENDDYWILLVDGVPLNAPGSVVDKGSACSFVRGTEWANPGKPRVVLEILEKTSVQI